MDHLLVQQIAVDTSALMAILLNEYTATACADCLTSDHRLVMSTATLSESLIVAAARNLGPEITQMVSGLGIEIVPVTGDFARRVAQSYARWGKGIHPASLNFGDCFAYQVARDHVCPLLYIGNDFSKTAVASAI